MPVDTSIITARGRTTVPAQIRAALGLKLGSQLIWNLSIGENGRAELSVRRKLGVDELAGGLKSDIPFKGLAEEKRAARRWPHLHNRF